MLVHLKWVDNKIDIVYTSLVKTIEKCVRQETDAPCIYSNILNYRFGTEILTENC